MICPKCKSTNVSIQTQQVTKRHGIIWWLCFGWNVGLILTLLGKKKQVTTAVCQNCGKTWPIK